MKGILGKKIGMTQMWTADGQFVAVTAVQAGPCPVVQVKVAEKDGYSAVQIGYEEVKEKHLSKAEKGHQKQSTEKGAKLCSQLTELRDFDGQVQVGDLLSCDIFQTGDKVQVRGISKGKGFQGVVKRHGFGGGKMTHGSKFHRAPGSVGAGTDPSRIGKGKRMPGRMGNELTSVKNLEVVRIMPEENLILLKGSVPGSIGSVVIITQN